MSAIDKTQIDKDKLKEKLEEKFDVSHFDPNTVIRGAQLTLVGGEEQLFPILHIPTRSIVTYQYLIQLIAHFKTQHCSPPITIAKLRSLSWRVLLLDLSSLCL
jgi:hypothetical protein